MDKDDNADIIKITGEIVSAYVSRNTLDPGGVTALIEAVADSLRLKAGLVAGAVPEERGGLARERGRGIGPMGRTPAVPVEQSVQPDHIVCLEDGKRLRVLTRYLKRAYGMTADEYRAKWGLPADYPMTAPALSARRSDLAKDGGFGKAATAGSRTPRRRRPAGADR